MDAATDIITTVAGNGTPGYSGDGGPAAGAVLSSPEGVAVGSQGVLLIGDTGNNRVRMVDNFGTITTVAGNGEYALTGDDGPGTGAGLRGPRGVLVDSQGNVFIADTYNHRVRMVEAVALPTPTPTATPTATPAPTSTPPPTATPTATATPSPTAMATATPMPSPTPTATPSPVPTATATPSPTPTPTPTATPTPEPTATASPTPTATPTVPPSPTPAPTSTATPVPGATYPPGTGSTPSPTSTASSVAPSQPTPVLTVTGSASKDRLGPRIVTITLEALGAFIGLGLLVSLVYKLISRRRGA